MQRSFTHVHFSDKLKALRIGPFKIPNRLFDVSSEFLSQDGATFHIHRSHLIPNYPKEPLLYLHLSNFMLFSDSLILNNPKLIKDAYSDSSPFNSDISISEDDSSRTIHPVNTETSLPDTSFNKTNI